jgi:hypothetical protein
MKGGGFVGAGERALVRREALVPLASIEDRRILLTWGADAKWFRGGRREMDRRLWCLGVVESMPNRSPKRAVFLVRARLA